MRKNMKTKTETEVIKEIVDKFISTFYKKGKIENGFKEKIKKPQTLRTNDGIKIWDTEIFYDEDSIFIKSKKDNEKWTIIICEDILLENGIRENRFHMNTVCRLYEEGWLTINRIREKLGEITGQDFFWYLA